MNAIIWGLLLLSYAIGPATLKDGRCSHCKRMGLRSTVSVYEQACVVLAVYRPNTFDENGKLVEEAHPSCPPRAGRCSRGHEVIDGLAEVGILLEPQ